MPTEKTGLGRVHAKWIGQDLEQSQQVPILVISDEFDHFLV
jgi:hypothetical protein